MFILQYNVDVCCPFSYFNYQYQKTYKLYTCIVQIKGYQNGTLEVQEKKYRAHSNIKESTAI